MKVLVVDDSESIRELLAITLEGAGYQVIKSTDGKDALQKLTDQTVNLVITDLNMPKVDGIELVKNIRKQGEYAGLPILLLTTESQVNKKEEAKLAGATGWIIKPFAQDKLLAVVQKVMR
ncbi:MAG: response regulator [Chryseotalea sp.]|jgi:two-component system chemotaxis response regulator CheY